MRRWITSTARRAQQSRLVRDAAKTYLATGAMLPINLLNGIVIARSLGPAGRGELTAILVLTQVLAMVFAAGCMPAIAYHLARNPGSGGRLLATWTVMMVPLGILAIACGEVLVLIVLDAQREHVADVARVYIVSTLVTLLVQPVHGMIVGSRAFSLWNALRVAQPLLILSLYGVLLAFDQLSLETALAATVVSTLVAGLIAAVPTVREHGWGPIDLSLGRATFAYGVRALGSTIAEAINLRLDLLVLPALVTASSLGFYAVAANIAVVLVTISTPLWWLVLPNAAARRRERSVRTVLASMHVTLGIGLALALLIGVSAGVLVPALYGSAFSQAVQPLRLLLPGCVLLPAAAMLTSGLWAANRPLTAAVPHIAGGVVTVAGLLLFLRDGGIEAAAIVTSCAYATVFVLALALYRRVAQVRWRSLLPSRASFAFD